jgi:hypothetical protein
MENKIDPYLPSLAGVRVLETIQNGTPPVRAFPALCKCGTQLIPPIVVAYLAVTSKIKEKMFKSRQKELVEKWWTSVRWAALGETATDDYDDNEKQSAGEAVA